jgi:hypothetical protein
MSVQPHESRTPFSDIFIVDKTKKPQSGKAQSQGQPSVATINEKPPSGGSARKEGKNYNKLDTKSDPVYSELQSIPAPTESSRNETTAYDNNAYAIAVPPSQRRNERLPPSSLPSGSETTKKESKDSAVRKQRLHGSRKMSEESLIVSATEDEDNAANAKSTATKDSPNKNDQSTAENIYSQIAKHRPSSAGRSRSEQQQEKLTYENVAMATAPSEGDETTNENKHSTSKHHHPRDKKHPSSADKSAPAAVPLNVHVNSTDADRLQLQTASSKNSDEPKLSSESEHAEKQVSMKHRRHSVERALTLTGELNDEDNIGSLAAGLPHDQRSSTLPVVAVTSTRLPPLAPLASPKPDGAGFSVPFSYNDQRSTQQGQGHKKRSKQTSGKVANKDRLTTPSSPSTDRKSIASAGGASTDDEGGTHRSNQSTESGRQRRSSSVEYAKPAEFTDATVNRMSAVFPTKSSSDTFSPATEADGKSNQAEGDKVRRRRRDSESGGSQNDTHGVRERRLSHSGPQNVGENETTRSRPSSATRSRPSSASRSRDRSKNNDSDANTFSVPAPKSTFALF